MPDTRIAIRKGKTAEYRHPLIEEMCEALNEMVGIKDGGRLMTITEHREHEFASEPCVGWSGLGALALTLVAAATRAWATSRARENTQQSLTTESCANHQYGRRRRVPV